jgi:sulfite reductase alpha subunit-like flavoprotein
MSNDLKIAFGSQTGNAKNLAYLIGEQLESRGLLNEVLDSLGRREIQQRLPGARQSARLAERRYQARSRQGA